MASHWGFVFSPRAVCHHAPRQLAPHVQRAPNEVRWKSHQLDLEGLPPRLRDSAPGPDGVPYSAWVATADATSWYLWQAYCAIIEGVTPPVEFLASPMVFLPSLNAALCIDSSMTRTQLATALLCHDVALSIYNARRHGDRTPMEGLIAARTQVLCRYSHKTKELMSLCRGLRHACDEV